MTKKQTDKITNIITITSLIFLLLAGSFNCGALLYAKNQKSPQNQNKVTNKTIINNNKQSNKTKTFRGRKIDTSSHWTLTSTYYHAVPNQTNSRYWETANGEIINYKKLKQGTWKTCAVSRDLLKLGFKYGDEIYISELNDIYRINDTMHPRFSRRIDILIDVNAKPMAYQKLTIRKVIV